MHLSQDQPVDMFIVMTKGLAAAFHPSLNSAATP